MKEYDYSAMYGSDKNESGKSPVKRRACPKCRGTNISYQTVTESKPTGCGTIILYVALALTIFGLLIIIPLMLRKKTRTVTYAVCQDCGHRWVIRQN